MDPSQEPKVGGMAPFDWALSLGTAGLIGHYILKLKSKKDWALWFVVWVSIGVFTHKVLGYDTLRGYYRQLKLISV